MILPTASDLKSDYLFGLSLADSSGNIYSDAAINRWIVKATAAIETELGVCVSPTTVTSEPHDYRVQEYDQFCFLQLFKIPVASVTSVIAKYGGQTVMTFPVDWVKLLGEHGQIQLVPTTGSLSQVLLGQGTSALLPLITGALSQMPFLFEVTYTAGFAAGEIPSDICDVICMQASIGILQILGDLVLAPGVSSASLSIDGLSQNISTVKSAQGGAFAGRITQYQNMMKDLLPALHRKYHGVRLVVA